MQRTTSLSRRFYAVPVIGWIARDVIEGDADNKWYLAAIMLTALVLSVATWGPAALVLLALTAVPVCMLTLVALTRG